MFKCNTCGADSPEKCKCICEKIAKEIVAAISDNNYEIISDMPEKRFGWLAQSFLTLLDEEQKILTSLDAAYKREHELSEELADHKQIAKLAKADADRNREAVREAAQIIDGYACSDSLYGARDWLSRYQSPPATSHAPNEGEATK